MSAAGLGGLTPEQQAALREIMAGRGFGGYVGAGAWAGPSAPYQVYLGELPAGTSAHYAGEDWNKFMADWGPLIQKQMGSLTDNSMVERAVADAARTPGQVAGAVDRNVARRGGVQGDQRLALDAARTLYNPLQAANTINNARIDQRTRNFDTALKLSGLGTDVYQMGLDNIRESEGLAAQRKMNNDASKAAWKQNLIGGGLTLAAAVMGL